MEYIPIGVWVQGPGPGIDLLIKFLPGNKEQEDNTKAMLKRMRDYGTKNLANDFLEAHRESLSPYRGLRVGPINTSEYASKEACATAILDQISPDNTDLWFLSFSTKDGKYIAYGPQQDEMKVYKRSKNGLEGTGNRFPIIPASAKRVSIPKKTGLNEIRKKYGPVLTKAMKRDIESGKIKPKTFSLR